MAQITLLPTPVPSSTDPTNFDTHADAFLTALPTFATEANVLASELNSMSSIHTGLASTYPADGGTVAYNTGSGSLSLTIQKNKAFKAGQSYTLWSTTSPATYYMTGTISSYTASTGAIVLTRSTSSSNSATVTWMLTVQGPVIANTGSTIFLADNFGIL